MDPEIKKKVLRQIPYGLYILAARADGDVAAAAVTWLSQSSFDPPLVMVAIKADSQLHAVVERGGAFSVNILASGQKDVASAFFRPSQVAGDRINGYAFEPGPATGSPLLIDLPAWFEARVVEAIKRGDHNVFVAEVVEAGLRDPAAKPLLLSDTGWSYGG